MTSRVPSASMRPKARSPAGPSRRRALAPFGRTAGSPTPMALPQSRKTDRAPAPTRNPASPLPKRVAVATETSASTATLARPPPTVVASRASAVERPPPASRYVETSRGPAHAAMATIARSSTGGATGPEPDAAVSAGTTTLAASSASEPSQPAQLPQARRRRGSHTSTSPQLATSFSPRNGRPIPTVAPPAKCVANVTTSPASATS